MTPSRIAVIASLCVVPAVSAATDRVSYPYAGVVHTHRTTPWLDAHVVTIDLSSASDVVVTRPSSRWATVSRFAAENDAQIAINANFFDSSVCGLSMGDAHVWGDAYVENCDSSMAFGPTATGWRAALFDSDGFVRQSPISWATQIVTGWPTLLDHGAMPLDPHEPNGMYRTHPRTAIGVAPGGTTLIIVDIEGRQAGLPGATSLEIIPLLEEFGASDAINLDGGGSTALWIGSEGGIVNRPSDGFERPVMNHIGVRIAGRGR